MDQAVFVTSTTRARTRLLNEFRETARELGAMWVRNVLQAAGVASWYELTDQEIRVAVAAAHDA